MIKKEEPRGLTITTGHFTENLYDFLNTGSYDPIEIRIPWRVYKLDGVYRWMVTYPTHQAKSRPFKDYEKLLNDFQKYCIKNDHDSIKDKTKL